MQLVSQTAKNSELWQCEKTELAGNTRYPTLRLRNSSTSMSLDFPQLALSFDPNFNALMLLLNCEQKLV